ncbi:unnamed protein product [Rhizoctonia solani]|uniref:Uncharacterized protein n=1 Tax=Rhizoctonia solani TaxID=456999 RepID=A0A8H3CXK1_9AGAM|nr:unnamed protein product [Rhizoctonia solani]
MGARNQTLVRCVATTPPDRDAWFNTLLWVISLFQLLINIGRGVLPPSQSLARQIRQSTSPRLPFISEPTRTSDIHRASLISSEPINRGSGTGENGSTTETPSSTPPPPDEQVALQTHSGQVGLPDADSRQPNPSSQNPSVSPKPITRLLLYGADNEAGVFISDMRKFAYACCRHLGSHSQVDDRVVMGDIGFEFGTFFNQTNVRIDDMLIFGVSGHGSIRNNVVTFCLSTNIHISIRVSTYSWSPAVFLSTVQLRFSWMYVMQLWLLSIMVYTKPGPLMISTYLTAQYGPAMGQR